MSFVLFSLSHFLTFSLSHTLTIFFLAAVCIQLYFWLWTSQRRRPRAIPQGASHPVSVVICVHQDVEKLKRLIEALLIQKYPEYEIVIVNDGPNQEISAFLSTFAQDDRFRMIEFDSASKKSTGKKEPLSMGIRSAKYDWLVLTDGDCLPGPEWIAGMMRRATGDIKMVLGYAPFFSKPGMLNSLQRFENLVTAIQYLGAARRGTPYMGVGRNLLYHRALFTQSNGFDRHMHIASGDDDLFVQEVATADNTTICMDRNAFVYSEAPESLTAWLHQKRRHLSASQAYSMSARIQNTLFALSWLLLWVLLPLMLTQGSHWYLAGIVAVLVFWTLFARFAFVLGQNGLTPWYPLLAVAYCLLLCTFAILLILPPPKTWMKS